MAKRWKSVVICVLGVLMLTGAIGCSGQPLQNNEIRGSQQWKIERQQREIAHGGFRAII